MNEYYKNEKQHIKQINRMRNIVIDKVVIHCNVARGDRKNLIMKASIMLEGVTGQKVQFGRANKYDRSLSCYVTVRGLKAIDIFNRVLMVQKYELPPHGCYTDSGDINFDIEEHIDLGIRYNRYIGIFGLNFNVCLKRIGGTQSEKNTKVGKKHKITYDDARQWFKDSYDCIISYPSEYKLSLHDAQIKSLSTKIKRVLKLVEKKDEEITILKANLNKKSQQIQQYDTKLNETNGTIREIRQEMTEESALTDAKLQSLTSITEKIELQMKSFNDRITQITEEEKGNNNSVNIKNILDEINNLKKEIHKIKTNKNENASDQKSGIDKLKLFFELELGFPEYFDAIIEAGFEDIQSLRDLTNDDLKELNVKIAHRKRILRAIQASVVPQYEGGTASI
eukprot:422616_1